MPPSKVTRAWVEERLDTIYPAHTDAFAYLLVALRKEFDGDLDALLLLAVIACGTRGGEWHEALLSGGAAPDRAFSAVNASSLAQITGIPRETVRRKLSALLDRGWIRRDARGEFTVGPGAATDLRTATHATITYITALLNAARFAESRSHSDPDTPAAETD